MAGVLVAEVFVADVLLANVLLADVRVADVTQSFLQRENLTVIIYRGKSVCV